MLPLGLPPIFPSFIHSGADLPNIHSLEALQTPPALCPFSLTGIYPNKFLTHSILSEHQLFGGPGLKTFSKTPAVSDNFLLWTLIALAPTIHLTLPKCYLENKIYLCTHFPNLFRSLLEIVTIMSSLPPSACHNYILLATLCTSPSALDIEGAQFNHHRKEVARVAELFRQSLGAPQG